MAAVGCVGAVISTIQWQEDGNGFRQFYTNDIKKTNSAYYYPVNLTSPDPMPTVEAELKKVSGYQLGSYGIFFCYQDSSNYYKLWLNVNQEFRITEFDGGSPVMHIGWQTSTDLNAGYNSLNKVRIERDGSGNFDVFFNDASSPSAEFTDLTFTGGDVAYWLWVSGEQYEFFPIVPVDVRFMLTEPAIDADP
jgi:hypothetical protein